MTKGLFHNLQPSPDLGAIMFCVALASICLVAGPVQASGPIAGESATAGHISFVLGEAYLTSPGKGRQRAEIGAVVRESDHIVTAINGHVHIRFIDQALISVRPDSDLEIVQYTFDPGQPEKAAIKLNLLEGVTRSISGKAGKMAKDRFRLNTPIVAIGIRGTDFAVSVTNNVVRALVNEGTIVLAPYSSECVAEAFGPCSLDAVELSDTALQIIEFRGDAPQPRLLPLLQGPELAQESTSSEEQDAPPDVTDELAVVPDNPVQSSNTDTDTDTSTNAATQVTGQSLQSSNTDTDTSTNAATQVAGQTPDKEAYKEAVALDPVNASALLSQPAETELATSDSVAEEPQVEAPPAEEPPAPDPVIPDFVPESPVPAAVLTARQLVWGRWSNVTIPSDRIALGYSDAEAGRKVSVGNKEFMLFRTENGPPEIASGLGPVSFELNSAQASYHSEAGTSPMQVRGGSLDIDFDTNQFATALELNHSALGAVNFQSSGRLHSGGYFYKHTENSHLAGAVSLDGSEAGYFFEQLLQTGTIKGLTLWDNR